MFGIAEFLFLAEIDTPGGIRLSGEQTAALSKEIKRFQAHLATPFLPEISERRPCAVASEYLPRVLPHSWRIHQQEADGDQQEADGFVLADMAAGISIIATFSYERDGKPWMHISVARRDNRVPTYEQLALVRSILIRPDQHAYQVFPSRDEYVNMAPVNGGKEVLHMFVPLGHRPLPDFRIERSDGYVGL